ncbi:MAG: DNA-processing protein DprA [Bacteroidetes bacterium]|nr:DNA-processing protein DprA [Bacteroidota bacterium]
MPHVSSRRSTEFVDDDADEHRAIISLSLVDGIGPGRIRRLIRRFGSARAVLNASAEAITGVAHVGQTVAARIAQHATGPDTERQVDQQMQRAARVGAYLVTEGDERYPRLLRHLHLPPPFLWVRGSIPPAGLFIAVVGTRRPTDYGKHVTRHVCMDLAARGTVIVSGLAYGIDLEAHKAAVDSGAETVAVLGSGVDVIYPGRHAAIASEIERNGAVVSEFPLGAKPDASNFPQRNRVISGMSHGTVVVEAYEKGGALITALQALEQNREVFAVPGRATSDASAGTNRLIRDSGAKLVLSAEDIFAEFGIGRELHSTQLDLMPLTGSHARIIDCLGSDVMQIDELCTSVGIPMAELLPIMLKLELDGAVRQYPGKSYGAARGRSV